jgi:phage terminase small subunit
MSSGQTWAMCRENRELASKCSYRERLICHMLMADAKQATGPIAEQLGVAKSTVDGILCRPRVKAYLSMLERHQLAKYGVDASTLTRDLIRIRDRCLQAEPVTDKDGRPMGEFKWDAANALRAIENMGKHIGYFKEDNEQQADKTLIVTVQSD